MRLGRFYQQNRRYVTAILAIALLLQAFIPQGFMPDSESDDAFALSICRASDIGKTPTQNAPQNEQDHEKDVGCAFMSVGASGVAVPIYDIAAPSFHAVRAEWYDFAALTQAARKYWQAQAPPHFS